MVTAEAGVIEDRDIEALHDFRVAIRRTRSLIKSLGALIDPAALQRFRTDFAWIAKSAGRQRDLDVLLQHLDDRQRTVYLDTRGVQVLRRTFARRRRVAHGGLLRTLATPRYRSLKMDWFDLLDSMRKDTAAAASAQGVVSGAIHAAWREVQRRGEGIGPRSRFERLHALRKDCKELRYLIEAFGDLYEADAIDSLTRALKRLQEALGAVCDVHIQLELLTEIAAAQRNSAEAGAVRDAVARWSAGLRSQLKSARAHFAKSYERFTRKRNRRLFRQLFAEA
jgi:CHAD domain-containing protein